jgi:hypothetical protein
MSIFGPVLSPMGNSRAVFCAARCIGDGKVMTGRRPGSVAIAKALGIGRASVYRMLEAGQ